MILPIKHISISIEASPTLVYGYAANGENLPNWASGLSVGIRKEEDSWVSESPMGSVKVKFAAKNPSGILDHTVTLPNGEKFLNPMRVIANGDGSELIFTLFRQSGMSLEDFQKDAETIAKDLAELKRIVEAKT